MTSLFARMGAGELARLGTMAAECGAEEITTALRVLAALHRDIREEAVRS
ncbi:hypothetical protein KZ829_13910 [Actinoplanes hulinensis]|uniref:MarR family transcriptional regulator n=1 Tax=Actinoplanes hulinensis TaxID=1144547 RepID=A0ABS7B1B0_9ACTN|nr:hypothetical protein [Actinoplanes hulinensis]MBW6434834.1 hypothetical protein [Actinoplanes hulinensis]